MSLQEFFILFHVLLFVYWLGGDIGVFYSSKFVVRPDLSKETRLIAAKIMFNLDLIPRICMSLMLTVGGILTEFEGIEHPAWQWYGILLLGPAWLAMVLILHFREGTPLAAALAKFDFWFRWAVIIGLPISTAIAWSNGRLVEEPWVAAKLLVFAALVLCGVLIRVALKPFAGAFHNLVKQGASDEDNATMTASLARVRPIVVVLWGLLVIEAWLGIVQPWSA